MDKQHAKFILQSYRPDGADATDLDFQGALQLAAEDRELGHWLAQERSHDIIFVEALEQVNIPETLKNEILVMMEHSGTEVDVSSEIDAIFVGALSQISPPTELKNQIVSAMEIEKKAVENGSPSNVVKFPTRWLNIAAVAAVALLTFTVIYSNIDSESSENEPDITSKDIEVQSKSNMISMNTGMILNASHEVDLPTDSFTTVNTWLEKEGMPVAKKIPEALISYDVKGGKKVTFKNGIEGSLIFFKNDKAEDYYLVVLDLKSVEDADDLGDLSEVGLKKCHGCPVTHYNTTSWKHSSEAYFLLTKADEKNMMELF